MKQLLSRLKTEHTDLKFSEGDHFYWSPKTKTVTYSFAAEHEMQEVTLLHELAHALLDHASFSTDFELLLMEVEAWDKAIALGVDYSIEIPEDHIQRCLDTYRDWLHLRSTCPSCMSNGIQNKRSRQYKCPNCTTLWNVSVSRLCRPYRQVYKTKTP